MKKYLLPAVFCVFLASFVLSPAAALAETVSYTQTVKSSSSPAMNMNSSVWIKDDRLRYETTADNIRSVVISRPDGIYSYMPDQNLAIKIPTAEPLNFVFLRSPGNYLNSLSAFGAKKQGTETIGPYVCDVYTYNDQNRDWQVKTWVWQEKKIPVKILIKSPFDTTEIKLDNITVGGRMSDDLFEIPENVRLIDSTNVMSAMQSFLPGQN